MKHKLLVTAFSLFACFAVFAQPANNNCNQAQSLGNLPTPGPCPGGVGATTSVTGTNVGATGANPYTYLLGCQPAGNQAAPALDVWYSFTATGNQVVINMSGSLPNPNVAMWTGPCNNLVGFDCAIGTAGGNLSVTFEPTTPGQTYYLQVSGNTPVSTGTFTLTVSNNNDCSDCLQISNLTVSPAPVNGTYGPNQTVTFCYTITSWNQVSANWLHGVTPSFGCGWNLSTLAPSGNPPPGGSGYDWFWGNGPNGWGWWVDYDPVGPGGPDGIFTNNYGDPTISGTGSWTFCWSITTAATCACPNLNMTINTTSDGETGSWTSVACQNDASFQFSAMMNCCAVSAVGTNVTCNGASTGTATATPTSGTGPYTYSWAPTGGTAATATGLAAGTYTVTQTDNNGCVSIATVTITQPPAITVTPTQTNVTCNGICNGSASVVATGGTGTYTYLWSPGGQTTSSIAGQCAGSYTVTVSSPAGCTRTQIFTITQPPAITLTPTQTNVLCNGACTGTASVVATGGNGTYTYLWAPGGQTTSSITGQCAGSYTVTVSSPAGCTRTQTFTITQPPAITLTPTQTNIVCNGACTGTASVVATGGNGTYTYLWAPGGQTTSSITGQCAGSYTVTVSSPAGCTRTQIFTITQPPAITITPTQTNVTCFGGCTGAATGVATGGTGTYTYVWSPAPGAGQGTANATGLCAGTYTLTVSSPAGCTRTQIYTITAPPAITLTPTQTNVTCNAACTGTASVTATGGTGTYTYVWAPGGQTTSSITGQCAGSYTVTVSSPAGCTATQTYTITQPPAITLTPTQTNVLCNAACTGTASVVATGGNGTYTYLWAPGGQTTSSITGQCAGSYTVTVSSPAGCTATQTYTITQPPAITLTPTQTNVLCNGSCTGAASVVATGGNGTYTYLWAPGGQTTAGITAQCAGSYTVTVSSPAGCTRTQIFTITAPPALTSTGSQTNILCNAACTGAASVTVTGGVGPYTYLWAPSGGTAAGTTGRCVGTYTVTFTDANGCTGTRTFSITQPPALASTITATAATCNLSNGSASVSVSGGVGPYTYLWAPLGGTTATVTGRPAGTYTVTYTDANGCTGTATVTILNNAAPTATITATVNITCFGASTGGATVTASGGTGPYTYSWAPSGGTGSSTTGRPAGTYTVTVTDVNGCTVQATVTITQAPAITLTPTQTNVLCNGGATGSASVTATGGTGTYTYSWAPSGGTGSSATGLTAQTYTVTVSSPAGCTATQTFNITAPPALTSTGTQTNILCNGTCTGVASVTVSGGVGPYTYLWAPSGGTGSSATALCVGSYTVTFTDANGCTGTRAFTITQPTALAATTSFTQATCNMSNGSASVSVSGGVGPYTYLWAPLGGTTATVTGRPAGTYTVTYTDANGCTGTATVTIPNAAAPSATITATVNVTCFGGNNGSATVAASGGTGPYTYAWSPTGGTGATGTPLIAGNYTVTVSDANGCTVQATVTITQAPAITLTPTQTNVLCNGGATGSASVTATGGTGTYTYSWAPSGGTGSSATGLTAQTYTVTVSSPAGCTATQTFNITAPPALTSTGTQTNILCNAACTGVASVTVSGGVGPYTYLWAPSGGTGSSATALCVGSYTVTFTDANGCTGTRSFTITQPTALAATTSFTQATCNMSNGSASVSVSGGVGPYTYLWAPLGGTTATVTGRPAGTYTVTYTDANGCTGTATVTIPNAAAPTATITATVNVTCFGGNNGSATVAASGGTGPYTYAWSPTGGTGATGTPLIAGNYTVTVSDANGCTVQATVTITQAPAITLTPTQTNVLCNGGATGSASVTATGGTGTYTYSWAPSGGTGSSATGLTAQTYTVTVSSPAGCTATQTYTITAPPALTSTGTQTNILCNAACTGVASVTVSGGVGPYTYLWAPSGGTGSSATALCVGSYTVTFTDANGCTGTRSFTITQPTALAATTSFTQATCNMSNGSASVSVSGGVGPYTYLWAPSGGTAATATGLAANTYTVTFTDANSCTGTATVVVPNAAAPTATITATTNVLCFGGNNGSATVAASGGTGPYTYAWSPTGGTGATGTPLIAGSYTVTVSDANGCTVSATTAITQPPVVTATAASSPVLCNGGSTGSATVTPGGGVGPYTYAWAPTGGTATTATGLNATTYTVTVTDANGCTITATTTVTQPTALTATATSSPVLCNGGSTGSATVTAAGGTGPYTYAWAPTGGTATIATGLNANTYTVTVTDANGCTITATTTVTQPTALAATTSFTQATCNMSNGSASVSVSGGVGPYTYLWAPSGGTAATATGLAANTYTVTYTDANSCTGTATVVVPNAAAPTATITATTNVSCFGGNNGSATVAASGGTGPYTYAWSPIGGTGSTGTALTAQSYTVVVTDANGCTVSATTAITQPPVVTATAASSPVLCNGGSTGSATVTPGGGVGPYTYAWAPTGGTAAIATGLNATTYTVTVTDANGCTITATTTVTQPTALTATATSSPVLCNGGSTGSATVTATGGTGPYTYSWAPTGGTATIATGLNANTYTVTVTDANGCTITATTTVTQPTALAATTSFTQATCNASNGSASVNVTGGVGPYTYLWAPSGGTAATATGLAANTYTVTFTDANSCTGTATVVVPNAGSPTATITATTNVSCFSGTNGSATVAASGGTGPYTYSWSPSGGTGTTATGLNANSYTVTVTDVNGCSITASTTITQPTALTATAASSPVLCFGGTTGSATVTPTGGITPYTYAWTPIGGTNPIATGLTAQSYTITVTDANGCTVTATTTVTQPTAVTATATMSPVLCNGGNTGSATVTPGGGIGPYTYMWMPSAQITATATSLTAQSYTVTVTDANGCSITASTTVTQPTALTATTSFTQATCNASNGSASVTVSGGIGPYVYSWAPIGGSSSTATSLPANTYTVTFTDANGCSDTAQVVVPNASAPTATITAVVNVTCFGGSNGSATVACGGVGPFTYAWSPAGGTGPTGSPLTAGPYTVTVTDANGCSVTATATITQPPVLTSSGTVIDVLCNGNNTGSATATAVGGVGPYTYAWSSSGTNPTETGLTAGNYTCVITDANSCSSTVSVTITEPPALTSTISGVDVLCAGGNTGSATVTPAGGNGPYTYNWTPGPQSTQVATLLVAGNYSCDITDANGCSITLTIAITEPGALTAITSFTQSTCGASNGIANVVCNQGVGPYTYLWSPLGGTGATTVGVPTGNYTCVIVDANGCSLTTTVNVPSAGGPTATIAPPTMVSCFGGTNGQAIVTPNGGTGPYTYAWNNSDTDSIAGGLVAGNYNVLITDANGCTATATVLIVEPTLLSVQANAAPSSVCEGTPVSLSASAGGGTPAYQFDWTPVPMTGPNQTVTPLTTTTYTVTVTDFNGCTVSQAVTVTVNPLPVVLFAADVTSGCATLCVNFSDLTTMASGSITGWSWDFGDGNTATTQNPSHCYTDAGVYSVTLTVTSAAGCTQTLVMNNYITVFANPVASFGASPQPTTILDPEICFTDSSILADQWSWNFGDLLNSASTDQNPCFTYVDPTCYLVSLLVTSPNGCTDTDTQTVCITPDVSIYVPNTFTPDGNGLNDIFNAVTIGIDPDKFEMWIFDRWGNMIYYTDDLDDGWDGRVQGHSEIVQEDTYVWKIKAKDVMGNQHNLIGHVNVIK